MVSGTMNKQALTNNCYYVANKKGRNREMNDPFELQNTVGMNFTFVMFIVSR